MLAEAVAVSADVKAMIATERICASWRATESQGVIRVIVVQHKVGSTISEGNDSASISRAPG